MLKIKMGCVILTILFFESLASAGIWIDNFDDGKVEDWDEIEGEWEIEDGAYAEKTAMKYAKTMFGDVDWTNYTVEVDVTFVEAVASNCAGLLVRADEEGDNGYRFWIRADSWQCQLAKWMPNNNYELVEEQIIFDDFDIEVGETYHLKVIIEGQRYQCFVNDNLATDYEDQEEFRKNGRVGFITSKSYPHFDNFVISGPDIPSNFSVEPESKLAICWRIVKSSR